MTLFFKAAFALIKDTMFEELDRDDGNLSPDTRIDSLDLDSFDRVELMLGIEWRAKADLDTDVLDTIETLGQLAERVAEAVAAQRPGQAT